LCFWYCQVNWGVNYGYNQLLLKGEDHLLSVYPFLSLRVLIKAMIAADSPV